MWVTVWRHGEAGMAPRDEDRCLTSRGELSVSKAATEFMLQLLDAGDPAPERLAFSPLQRTRQTAAILGQSWHVAASVCDALAPGTSVAHPETFLVDHIEHQVIVSHQPFVSQLIGYWLDDNGLDSLLPGGWATLKLTAPCRGGGRLLRSRTSIFA